MKKYISIIIVLLLFITISADGQSQREQRHKEAIIALNQTAFTENFKEYKEAIEYNIEYFQENQDMLSEEEIAGVRKSYIVVQEKFNTIFDDLRYDFTNSKRQKAIFNTPDSFTRDYQGALEEARHTYQSTCQKQIDFLTNSDSASASAVLVGILTGFVEGLVTQLVGRIKDSKKDFKGLSEAYFETEYASKLRLKDWEEYESYSTTEK